MKAQVIQSFGEPSVFETLNLPDIEQVPPNHVLICVSASSVNPVDCKIRSGKLASIAPAFPAILHGDVAGVVTQIGEGVNSFRVGDEVYGCSGGITGINGALAEYMLVDADLLALKPQSLTMTQAAALPLVSITAYEALIQRAQIKPEQTVLVHGATGGVGHIAIQLAKAKGAKVFATASNSQKMAIAKQLGADIAINYRDTPVEDYVDTHTKGRGFDVAFDTVGKDNLDRCFQAVNINGVVTSISTRSTHDLSILQGKGLTLHSVFMLIPLLYGINRANHGTILTQIARWVDEGKITPLIDTQAFKFSEVAQAHRHAESGSAIGKVTLTQDLSI